MVRYRVDELAAAAGISVELIRSYQSRQLLAPPRHEGRVAYYDRRHLERLQTIRDLKARGHSLRAIASMLGDRDGGHRQRFTDTVLDTDEQLSLVELAERTRVPPAMLRSLEASGVLRPANAGNEAVYTGADVRAVRMLLSLVGSGVPMEEFMAVARVQLAASDSVAHGAVDLFMRYVREPLRASGLPQKEEAERLVAAFRLLSQAASSLIAYNFTRTLLNEVQREIEARGTRAERAALRREADRRSEVA
jgi:DNA-binding transcriptional MerR regulator